MLILRFPDDGQGGGGSPAPVVAAPAVTPAPVTTTPATPAPSHPQTQQLTKRSGQPSTPSADDLKVVFRPPTDLDFAGDDGGGQSAPVSVPKSNVPSEPACEPLSQQPIAATQPVAPVAPAVSPTAQPVVPSVVVPAVTQPLVKLPDKPRDYSKYTQEQQVVLKQMSNEAFEFTTKQMEQAQLAAQHSFLQNPQAYILNPEYQRLNEDAYFLKQEASIHTDNLRKIVAGEEWTPLRGFTKEGQPVYDPKRAPTTMDAENVRMALMTASNSVGQVEARMTQFSSGYKQMISQGDQVLQAKRAEVFSWAADPKIMDQNIKVDGKDIPFRQVHDFIKGMLPPWYQNLSITPLLGDLWVAFKLEQQKNADLSAQNGVVQTKIIEAGKVEPTSQRQELPTATATNGMPSKFSLADAEREGIRF